MWLVLYSHLRAGMLFMSAFDAIGSGEIGWKVVFGLSPAICANIVPTDYRLTLTNVPQRRRLGLVLTKPSLILAFWRINFISVCFYFHTVCWDMLVALSASRNFIGPQNKTRAAVTWTMLLCLWVMVLRSVVHKISQECQQTCLQDQLLLSPFMHVSPLRSITCLWQDQGHWIRLWETVRFLSSPCSNCSFRISGNQREPFLSLQCGDHSSHTEWLVRRREGKYTNPNLHHLLHLCT